MKTTIRKFEQNRYLANKYCPCGKSNNDGKFATEKGFKNQFIGHCHGCLKDFWKDSETLVPLESYAPVKKVNYCNPKTSHIEETFDYNLNSGFAKFLVEVFGFDKATKAVEKYYLGVWESKTVFWQIDQTGDPRAAKIINYKRDGHREGYPNWHHTLVLETECQLKQTFFGAHLIPNYDLPIAVAEGAKAAVIMSLIRPEYIWISAESKGGLNKKKCDSIAEYDVTLFPDAGCYELWKSKGDLYGFKTTKEVELLMQKGYIDDGDDITDYYLNWPEFRAALKPKKIKKIDPEWDGFVKQNPELGFEKN